jgi:tRNA (guanine37-N1)-methyltransferase
MHFHIITLFPEAFSGYLHESILKRAITQKKVTVSFYNPKDFEPNKKKRIDDRPYGGGPGMVLRPEPVLRAIEKAIGKKRRDTVEIVWFEPHAQEFSNTIADEYIAHKKHLVLVCGRYEGIDARVKEIMNATPMSIGPYTLTGGELPAMVVIDAVSRRIKGVLGDACSVEERRVAARDVYTRPETLVWKKKHHSVPGVLKTGHHAKIDEWKRATKD